MTDPYSILGVDKNADDAEIKAAYRKLAKEHHPDRGGDNELFAKINAAYDSVKDAAARQKLQEEQSFQQYQSRGQRSYQGNPFDINEMFSQAFGRNGFRFEQQVKPRNRDVSVTFTVTVEDVYNCVIKNVNINFPNGSRQVSIAIPKGIMNGSQVRFPGMGDNSNEGPPGNLTIEFIIKPHNKYHVDGYDLIMMLNINVREAMIGTDKIIETLDNRKLKIRINPGTQPKTRLRIPESGLPQRNHPPGNLYIEVSVLIPSLTEKDLDKPLRDLL
jgi:curved DNA-binding protein